MPAGVMEAQSLDFDAALAKWTKEVDLSGYDVAVTNAPEGRTVYVGDVVDNAEALAARANLNVHTVVNYGQLLQHMTGPYPDPDGFFKDRKAREKMHEKGVYILGDHIDEAHKTATAINDLAQVIIVEIEEFKTNDEAVQEFLATTALGEEYYGHARRAYELTEQHVPRFVNPYLVALLRTGALTRRLSHGVDKSSPLWDEVHPMDVDIVLKRAHPIKKYGQSSDMWALAKWNDRAQLEQLHGRDVEIADFVLATGASLGGVVLSALSHRNDRFPEGVQPANYDFRFAIGTEAGVAFWHPVFKKLGIPARFSMLAASPEMNEDYYLLPPFSVWDAGDATQAFMPKIASQRSKQ